MVRQRVQVPPAPSQQPQGWAPPPQVLVRPMAQAQGVAAQPEAHLVAPEPLPVVAQLQQVVDGQGAALGLSVGRRTRAPVGTGPQRNTGDS